MFFPLLLLASGRIVFSDTLNLGEKVKKISKKQSLCGSQFLKNTQAL